MSVIQIRNGKFIAAWPISQSEADAVPGGYYGTFFWNVEEDELAVGNGGADGPGFQMRRDLGNSFAVETLSGTKTLTALDKPKQRLDPDGVDRDVMLPDPENRKWFEVKNPTGSTGNLVVKYDVTTISTITPGNSSAIYSDGTTWGEY
jgi:hypothetical protein